MVSGNGDNGYEVTEGEDRHIVNLNEKRCTCRSWDLTGIPCPHVIKAMKHQKMKPKTELSKYYSKEVALSVYIYKLQPFREELFGKVDPSQAIETPAMVKLVGRPKSGSSSMSNFEVDDEDALLMVRTESEQAYLQRLQRRLKPQQLIESRVISFRGDKYGVSEPTNLSISPTGLTWKGKMQLLPSCYKHKRLKS
ncbi:putative DNA-directed RNA polymerase I subunit rpa1-like [Capsicum annuum]|nr:putative DNA-directed RNA polymerase I subunit rpa1-like [Capsicum annuum]